MPLPPKPKAKAPPPAAPAAPPLRKQVVIDEGALTSLSLNPKAVAEFPILAGIAKLVRTPARAGCGSCGAAAKTRAKSFQAVKLALSGMGGDRKRKLKELMGAASARLLYVDAAGKPQQLIF